MRKIFNILWGALAVLYSVMYVQHALTVKHEAKLRHAAKEEPPFRAQVDMSIDGMNIYSSSGVFYCDDSIIFRLAGFGVKDKLQALAHNYAGKKVKLTFRREHVLLKEGYTIIPDELDGYFIIYHETHEEGTDIGELSATD